MHYNTIMSQLQTFIPRHSFETLSERYSCDRYVKSFTSWNQFTVMLYAQISGKDSLRDIQNSLTAQSYKLYHIGLPSVKRSTLADANQTRSYFIYEQLFYKILQRCRNVTPKHKFKFKNPLYAIDATVIDLCLSTFDWAKFRTTKGAIRLHYQFDHSGQIPTFMVMTDGKQHEITVARSFFSPVADSIYCFDKGYIDYAWLATIEKSKAFFVTRAKDNIKYQVIGQHGAPKNNNVISDDIIALTGFYQQQDYSKELRLIKYYDKENDRTFEFLTNNFNLSAYTIAQIYKSRWQIEIFFKWIKQNLKIKTFLGTSKNAVLTQVWIAMCYYLLLTYIKYQSKYKYSIFYLHKIIKTTIMERLNLFDLLNMNDKILSRVIYIDPEPQLVLNF
jgi:hypothetical protein